MPEPNPRIPYQMTTVRKSIPPLNGKPLMVHVVMNVEYWPFDQPMPRAVMPAPHGKEPVPDLANYSWVEYGMRVGMPRIMRLLEDRGIRASAFMNAAKPNYVATPARAEAQGSRGVSGFPLSR